MRKRRLWGRRVAVCVTAAAMAISLPASAGVTYDTVHRSYHVSGTTEKSIVRYMRQHPYRGDNGHAYANLKHRYNLTVETELAGEMCRVKEVDLDIDFTMTLPKSSNPGALTGSARRAFDGFVSFAKRHEEHHRASFVTCGRNFVAKAKRMRAVQCFKLVSDIRALLRKADAACEAGERSFDRQQSKAVNGLALFVRGRR
jgi:predicted secreted Zn-dependent protease